MLRGKYGLLFRGCQEVFTPYARIARKTAVVVMSRSLVPDSTKSETAINTERFTEFSEIL